jgi:regulator of replication initiation timing
MRSITSDDIGAVGETLERVCKQRDILKVENEALRGIIEEQQRRRLEEIAELRAMQAMITDLRVEISAITEG